MTLAERGVGEASISLSSLLIHGADLPISGQTSIHLSDSVKEIVTSGFPGLRNLPWLALRTQLDSYIQRIVEKDFEEVGLKVKKPALLLRWFKAYAAAKGTSASYEKIRDAATGGEGDKPAKTTALPYRDALQKLWIIDPLPAWLPSQNYLSQLARNPKHHLSDPALAARLLGLTPSSLLKGATVNEKLEKKMIHF
jgi:uncharacterized protein